MKNHIPVIRFGKVYESEEKKVIKDIQGQIMDSVSIAIPLVFQTDLKRNTKKISERLRKTDSKTIIEWVRRAGDIFANEDVIINGETQTPEEYCDKVKQVTGLPKWMCHDILKDMHGYMQDIDDIVCKQFRSEDLSILDCFHTVFHGMGFGLAPTSDVLCAVMPGNHPVVNMMWIIAFAMKYPIIVKPSFEEPYTPLRLIYSFIQAGADPQFFSYYPVEHDNLQKLVALSKCSILFGGKQLKEEYSSFPWVKVYGPGYSKIIADKEYSKKIDEVAGFAAESLLYHSGRACISTSSVIVEENGREIALAIADKMRKIELRTLEEEGALIAAVRDKEKAEKIEKEIKRYISTGKVIDMTPDIEIVQIYHNQVFMMPKVLYCEDIEESFFGIEYPFPFVMVGECSSADIPNIMKETLSCRVLTDNQDLMKQILLSARAEKIFRGYDSSFKMDYGMPHGGFLADFLYHYKAFKL